MKYTRLVLGTALAGLLACSTAARATAVTYSFAGSGDWSTGANDTAFSGSFTYDSTAVDGIADASQAAYAHASNAGWGLSLNVGGTVYSFNNNFSLLVDNDNGGRDYLGVLGFTADGQSLSLSLSALTSLLSDDSLTRANAGVGASDFYWIALAWDTLDGEYFQGTLSALDCTAGCSGSDPGNPGGGGSDPGNPGGGNGSPPDGQTVPEPASGALVALALAAAFWQRRRLPQG